MDLKRMEVNDIRWFLNVWEINEIEFYYVIIGNVYKWEEENSIG